MSKGFSLSKHDSVCRHIVQVKVTVANASVAPKLPPSQDVFTLKTPFIIILGIYLSKVHYTTW